MVLLSGKVCDIKQVKNNYGQLCSGIHGILQSNITHNFTGYTRTCNLSMQNCKTPCKCCVQRQPCMPLCGCKSTYSRHAQCIVNGTRQNKWCTNYECLFTIIFYENGIIHSKSNKKVCLPLHLVLIYPRAENVDFRTGMVITAIIELKIVKYFIVLAAILKKRKYFTFEAG